MPLSSLFPSLCVVAGVALHTTFLATTVRHAVLGRKECVQETVTIRICREIGRISTIDLAKFMAQVVVNGLSKGHLEVDTTMVSTLHVNGAEIMRMEWP